MYAVVFRSNFACKQVFWHTSLHFILFHSFSYKKIFRYRHRTYLKPSSSFIFIVRAENTVAPAEIADNNQYRLLNENTWGMKNLEAKYPLHTTDKPEMGSIIVNIHKSERKIYQKVTWNKDFRCILQGTKIGNIFGLFKLQNIL